MALRGLNLRGPHLLPCSQAALSLSLALALLACAAPWTATAQGTPPAGYVFVDPGPFEKSTDPAQGEYEVAEGTLAGRNLVYEVTPFGGTTAHGINGTEYPLLNPAQRTLRAFPVDQTGCYLIPVAKGRVSVRLGFAYYNYDGLNRYPKFVLNIGGTDVDTIDLEMWESPNYKVGASDVEGVDLAPTGGGIGEIHYGEYVHDFSDENGEALICFTSVDNHVKPIVNTIELIPYLGVVVPEIEHLTPWSLTLRHRIKLGGPAIAPDASSDTLLRRWGAATPRTAVEISPGVPQYTNITDPDPLSNFGTQSFIQGFTTKLPRDLFRSALQGGSLADGTKFLGIRLPYVPFSTANHLLARLYFRELDPKVSAQDLRVFNITFALAVDTNGAEGTTTYERTHWIPAQFSYFFDTWAATHLEPNYTSGTPTDAAAPYALGEINPNSPPARVPGNSNPSTVAGNPGFYLAQAGCLPTTSLASGQVAPLNLLLRSSSALVPFAPILSAVELYEIISQPSDLVPCRGLQEPFANPSNTTFSSANTGQEHAGLLSTGAVVAIAVTGALVVSAGAAVAFVLHRRWREERMIQEFHRFRATLD